MTSSSREPWSWGKSTADSKPTLVQADIASTNPSFASTSTESMDGGPDRSIDLHSNTLRIALATGTCFKDEEMFMSAIKALAQHEKFLFTTKNEPKKGILRVLCTKSWTSEV